jgi:hypothetical protein
VGSATRSEDEGVDEALDAVRELMSAGLQRRRAVELVAGLTGVPRNQLYRESL